jgi:hypothetical protein
VENRAPKCGISDVGHRSPAGRADDQRMMLGLSRGKAAVRTTVERFSVELETSASQAQ